MTNYKNLGLELYQTTTRYTNHQMIGLAPVYKSTYEGEEGKILRVLDYGNFSELSNYLISLTHFEHDDREDTWHLFYGYESIYGTLDRSWKVQKMVNVLKRVENMFEKEHLKGNYGIPNLVQLEMILSCLRFHFIVLRHNDGTIKKEFTINEGLEYIKEMADAVSENTI